MSSSSYRAADNSTMTTNTMSICTRTFITEFRLEYYCPGTPPLDNLEIDDLNSTVLESISHLYVFGMDGSRGPLTNIPSNICRFTNLTVFKNNSFFFF
jgi:hypothetical protein